MWFELGKKDCLLGWVKEGEKRRVKLLESKVIGWVVLGCGIYVYWGMSGFFGFLVLRCVIGFWVVLRCSKSLEVYMRG